MDLPCALVDLLPRRAREEGEPKFIVPGPGSVALERDFWFIIPRKKKTPCAQNIRCHRAKLWYPAFIVCIMCTYIPEVQVGTRSANV
ncbi:hypothetical protein PHLGIDRAFT_202125 [Phlebiopsis gigantea 11061_1 CR5-6]|uniref:Uncharacterized protein n=1 Tax=Phlebiopsis gigantea (strain 11061_1 CR5-6) TaxID=745531 RepID=A0A0C3RTW7_PHLG1|nr:hypothetical protein PHLGIDRAFT_202125 [Phlebiopsis gigantea 11061_1 CR5-6]